MSKALKSVCVKKVRIWSSLTKDLLRLQIPETITMHFTNNCMRAPEPNWVYRPLLSGSKIDR